MLLLPLLLGFLALALTTVRGLLAQERTPLPALAAVLATAAVLLGLVRFYLGAVEADEHNGNGGPDTATTVLLLGGAGAVLMLGLRLGWLTVRRSR